jgi:hypothetical protein
MQKMASEWAMDPSPWNRVVETARQLWGDQFSIYCLAVVAAGVKAKALGTTFADLFDHAKPLCERVRYARRKSGAPRWWEERLRKATMPEEGHLALLVCATWAGAATLLKLKTALSEKLAALSPGEWVRLVNRLEQLVRLVSPRQRVQLEKQRLPAAMDPRVVALIGLRLEAAEAIILHDRFIGEYTGDDRTILNFSMRVALERVDAKQEWWPQALSVIERLYRSGAGYTFNVYSPRRAETCPIDVARSIAAHPERYPRDLVYLAEERCQAEVEKDLLPVADIAAREKWFERMAQ